MNRALISVPIWLLIAAFLTGLFLVPQSAKADTAGHHDANEITEWQILWESENLTVEQVNSLSDNEGWITVQAGGEYPALPSGVKSAWLKFKLPAELPWTRPALLLDTLFSRDITLYIQDKKVFEAGRSYPFERSKYIIPVSHDESNKTVIMRLEAFSEKIGLHDSVKLGDHQHLTRTYMKDGWIDLILGSSLVLLAVFLYLSVLFTNRSLFSEWGALGTVILTVGIMLFHNSPFLHNYYTEIGLYVYYSFDIASSLLMPALFLLFEKILGSGPKGLIKTFRKIHTYLAAGYIGCMLTGIWLEAFNTIYVTVGSLVFALSILISVLLLIYSLYRYCKQSNREAVLLSSAFSFFALLVIGEMIWYFVSGRLYEMFLWKIGILVIIASLIIAMVRSALHNYNQMMKYSNQLEVFNNDLQRSEKIEMISQLAASVAHEVRNPLQVTRGFLQLLGERTAHDKEKRYMRLAIDELDRAAEIITDFLTFAKPGVELHSSLNLSEEIQQIKAILLPLVTMQGGILSVPVQEDVYVRGNSSKFKQAIINIIKNSIEALGDDGQITIQVKKTADGKKVALTIEDNGEGMEAEDLKHLGEPYYSKKTKGTGLGLMVTYRIIEAMNGEITYQSQIGKGTQVCIVFPSAINNADAV